MSTRAPRLRIHVVAAVACSGVMLLAGTRAFAQVRPPARDVAPIPTGTASMSGTVVTEDAEHRPVRHAVVSLSTGELALPASAVTDDDGRFTFANLPAGNYTLTATKAGYVSIAYGSKRPGRGLGVPIALTDAQRLTDLVVKVLRGGVIAGTVRYETGAPAPGQDVTVLGLSLNGTERKVSPEIHTATTDDRGMYRVFGLPPGDYVAQTRPGGLANVFARTTTRMVTDAEVRWASAATPAGAEPDAGQTVTYAPVYFPNSTNVAQATVIALGPAEEHDGVDIVTQLVPTARVTGVVLDPAGQPIANVNVSPHMTHAESAEDMISMMVGGAGGGSKADGTFTLDGLTPGHYALSVRTTPRTPGKTTQQDPAAALMAGLAAMLPGGAGGGATWWASEDVDVDGHDISNIALKLAPGMTMTGTIVFEPHTQPVPTNPASYHVMLMPAPTGSSMLEAAAAMLGGLATGNVAADRTFSVQGLTPNTYRIAVSASAIPFAAMLGGGAALGAPGGWVVKSVVLNGHDITDSPFDVRPNEDLKDVVITMTDLASEVSGQLMDSAGRPVSGFPIVIFSTDRSTWTLGSRRIQRAQPASDGKYRVAALPAGEYYVCAVTDLDETELYAPSFLESLVPGAFTIKIADGEKKVQDLKLSGGGQ